MTTAVVTAHDTPPWWAQYVTLTVELGISSTSDGGAVVGVWDTARWDRPLTGTWSGLEPEWTAVDLCALLAFSMRRGRARAYDRFPASSATVTIADPEGTLSWDSDVDADSLDVRPGRELRATAFHVASGVDYPVWRGWLEAIEDGFSPAGPPPARFTAQDALAQLAHINLPESSPVGAGELSGARVHRLLDLAEWPEEWRDVDTGAVTMQATNLARTIADDLGVTADSEGGALFVDREGRVAFRDRDWLRTSPEATTIQATIGGPAEDVCGAEYELIRTAGDVVNDVQVARSGGTMQRVENAASISAYRRRTWSRGDYVMETDADALALANRILTMRSGGQVRMTKLTIRGSNDQATWAFMLAVDYGWLLEVVYTSPLDPGVGWTRRVHVQSVEHRVTPDEWITVLEVDDPLASSADTWDGADGWDLALWSLT